MKGPSDISAAPGGAAPWPASLERRFHLSMLSVALVDSVFAILFRIAPERFLPTTALLVLATLAGGHLIFRPIRRYLRAPGRTRLPVRRIGLLGRICTVYMTAVVSVLALAKFFALPWLLGFDLDALLSPIERQTLAVIHVCYYAALIHFVMSDYAGTLRLEIFRQIGRQLPAGRQSIAAKLLVAFSTTSLLPLALIASTLADGTVGREELVAYLVAIALGTLVAIWFVSRSLLRPIRMLDEAVAQAGHGDLAAAAPVLSDDEIGRLAARFNAMTEGLRAQAFIRDTFGKYVPERVAKAIVAQRQLIAPCTRVATILYTDIADFTAIAASMSSKRVVEMLNAYFSAVIEPIEASGGVVNQFQGDAMLVTFNVPLEDARHAAAALDAAARIRSICERHTFAGVSLRTRIGIATGEVVAGNVGSDNRLAYTVHGDAVNLAARLEGLNKAFGTDVLVDEATALAAADGRLVLHGETSVRGRARPVTV